jgi:hypothetical protein
MVDPRTLVARHKLLRWRIRADRAIIAAIGVGIAVGALVYLAMAPGAALIWNRD